MDVKQFLNQKLSEVIEESAQYADVDAELYEEKWGPERDTNEPIPKGGPLSDNERIKRSFKKNKKEEKDAINKAIASVDTSDKSFFSKNKGKIVGGGIAAALGTGAGALLLKKWKAKMKKKKKA